MSGEDGCHCPVRSTPFSTVECQLCRGQIFTTAGQHGNLSPQLFTAASVISQETDSKMLGWELHSDIWTGLPKLRFKSERMRGKKSHWEQTAVHSKLIRFGVPRPLTSKMLTHYEKSQPLASPHFINPSWQLQSCCTICAPCIVSRMPPRGAHTSHSFKALNLLFTEGLLFSMQNPRRHPPESCCSLLFLGINPVLHVTDHQEEEEAAFKLERSGPKEERPKPHYRSEPLS